MDLRHSLLGRWYYSFIDSWLILPLQRSAIRPNSLTCLGLVLAFLVPLGFLVSPWLGLFLICISGLADSLDGYLARILGIQNSFGALLDSSVDRVSDCLYLLGFLTLFWIEKERSFLVISLFFSSLLWTLMISYTKAKIESLGQTCSVGIMDRAMRTLFFLVWALLLALCMALGQQILWIGLVIYWILTLVTLVQRLVHAFSVLAKDS